MIPPGCLVISFIFHFPIWIEYVLIWESSKRNHQLFSGWAWTSRNILLLLQPSSIGVSSRSSPQPAVEQWGCVLEVELVNQLGGIRRTHILSFFHQDFSFKQTKRDVGVDGNPGPSPHICWLNYPCHLQILTCFNDVFKGLVIPSYCTSSSVGSPIIYRVLWHPRWCPIFEHQQHGFPTSIFSCE